ncbi:hypothetical protein AAP_02334 [Ascosphaera apis ARSEF 7405]|uniref:Uncharacterized protein n=1 Tax=Ascosphaera apis ARSEF 7405 TaxID=392613 RepID=A0A168A6V8_9EURO|nr:hypothetical protein AAP_02334 [Ascosphaera apis ARSEF 7405]
MSSPSRPSTPPDDPTTVLLTHLTTNTSLVDDLHASLASSLHRSGWTERIRQLSYELLREGHCERFDEMMEVVCELVSGNKNNLTPAKWRGIKRKRREEEGEEDDDDNHESGSKRAGGVDKDENKELADTFVGFDVTLPESVVGEGVRHIKRAMHEAFEFEGDDNDTDQEDEPRAGDEDVNEDADADADGDAESEFNPAIHTVDIDSQNMNADADADAEPDDGFADLFVDTDNMFELDAAGFDAPSQSQSSQQQSFQAIPPDISSGTGSAKQNGATGKKWKSKSGSSNTKK